MLSRITDILLILPETFSFVISQSNLKSIEKYLDLFILSVNKNDTIF